MGNLGQAMQQQEFDELIANLSHADLILIALHMFNNSDHYSLSLNDIHLLLEGEPIPKTVDISEEHLALISEKMVQAERELTSRFNREIWSVQ